MAIDRVLREGDEVLVRATVKYVATTPDGYSSFRIAGTERHFPLSAVDRVAVPFFKAGDIVSLIEGAPGHFRVLAVSDDEVWVKAKAGYTTVKPAASLQIVQEAEEVA